MINHKMSICLSDLDDLIISFLELSEYIALMNTNNNYYHKIKQLPLIIEWNSIKRQDGPVTNIFLLSCKLGFISYNKSLFNRYNIDIHANNKAFELCCKYGHIEIAKWLYDLGEKYAYGKINIHCCNQLYYRISCERGHFEIYTWLVELSEKHGYDKNELNHKIFVWACGMGMLDIAKWLIEIGKKHEYIKIDIHYHTEAAFYWSCLRGQIKIAQWLIDLGENNDHGKINIHRQNYNLVKHMCQLGHHNIKQWLIDLGENHGYGKFNY